MNKHKRTQLTHQIEDTLSDYCRAGCPYIDSRDSDRVCATCPVGVTLQGFGKQLLPDDKPKVKPAPPTKWTEALDSKFIELMDSHKNHEMKDIAGMMELSLNACIGRKKRLRLKGLI